MTKRITRRRILHTGAVAGGIAIAGCTSGDSDDDEEPGDDDIEETDDDTEEQTDDDTEETEDEDETEDEESYEIWALDQGTNTVYIYEPDADGDSFEETDSIDFGEHEAEVPHMIDFSSDYEYAAIACTAGAKTVVVRTEDKEVVEVLETGAGSHMAAFSPDDEHIHVDAIGEETIVRIEADLEAEEFDIVDELYLPDDEVVQDAGIESASPICHQFTAEGQSYHTLGPAYGDAGLVILDHDDFSVAEAFSGDEVPTNCGTMPHPTESKFYLTAGQPSNPEEDVDGVGHYYVFDTEENEPIVEEGDTGGIDAHGFWYTPDGEELWVLNRETNDGVVIDPETDDVVDEIEAFGPAQDDDPDESDAPDILWSSPDGEYMFASLRGPDPVSGDPHAATGVTPGFSVLDVESREILEVVEPDPIDDYSDEDIEDEDIPTPDFHGIGVRPVGDYDSEIPNSPPF